MTTSHATMHRQDEQQLHPYYLSLPLTAASLDGGIADDENHDVFPMIKHFLISGSAWSHQWPQSC
jgi:hypothetical protein